MRKPSIRLKRFLERVLSIDLILQLNLLRRTIMSGNYSGTKEIINWKERSTIQFRWNHSWYSNSTIPVPSRVMNLFHEWLNGFLHDLIIVIESSTTIFPAFLINKAPTL